MAVNPNIALSVRGLELPDPLAQYGKVQAIQAAQQQNALAQMQMRQLEREQQQQNQLRDFIAGGVTPENRNKLLGFGEAGQKMYSTVLSGEKTKAEQQKAELGLLTDRLAYYRNLLPSVGDQVTYDRWRTAASTEMPQISQFLPEAYSPQGVRQLMMTADQELSNLKQLDLGGEQAFVNPYTEEVVSRFEKTPLPESVAAQKAALARASTPTSESAYSLAVGKTTAERDTQLVDQAFSAPTSIAKIDETLRLLQSGQPITGLASELETLIASAQAKFLRDEQAGVKVRDSQYLDALLGSDVFPQMSVLGVGARGLDTPAERKFLQEVITGQRQLTKEALIKITENRRKAFENQVKKYNERVESGELDRYFEASGLQKRKINIPSRSTVGGEVRPNIPQAAIDALLKGEGTDAQFDQYFGEGAAARVRGGR